jgi:myo-inositol 2-dehydrogenase/D-chiro-inositol 1-dehydrogenase
MNVLIVGDGPEEQSWAHFLADAPGIRLAAAFPGLKAFPGLPGGQDLDEALATAGIDAAVVGGSAELRAEALRRTAGAGLPIVALMPPGTNADPFYQIALSRHETGARVVPDLPGRLHPGVDAIRAAIDKSSLGEFRELRYEIPARRGAGDLVLDGFSCGVDVIRFCLGEIAAVTATGDPPGEHPSRALVVQTRGAESRRAEMRIVSDDEDPCQLTFYGSEGTLRLEHDPDWNGASRLIRRTPRDGETTTEIAPWDSHAAIFGALRRSVEGDDLAAPDLLDGTRAMELAEAVHRSLLRGRTVELDYEEMSEVGNFKSVMTGIGCGILLAILVVVPVALAGPALGMPWTIYLAWAIPPVLIAFVLLQLLRFGLKPHREARPEPRTAEAAREATDADRAGGPR